MKKLRDNKITASRKLAACAIALLQLFYYMRKPSRRPLAAMGWCDNFKRLRIRKCELSPRVMALQPTFCG
jgi:hypothetical protein